MNNEKPPADPFKDPVTGGSVLGEETNSSSEGSKTEGGKEAAYSPNENLDRVAQAVVKAIENANGGEPVFENITVEKMRKMATLAMKADMKNHEARYRPGNRLRTYTGVRNPDGSLKDETYGGEAIVGEGDTIYRNMDPIRYPEDWEDKELAGKPIHGRYAEDGTFEEDPVGGATLYNAYMTKDPEHPKKKYGIEPTPVQWQEGMAQIPSYLIEIPAGTPETEVITKNGTHIAVKAGDYIVVDDLGGGKTSVQAVERGFKERTYKPWE